MQNNTGICFDLTTIKKYNLTGPRYTSYPTAVVFDDLYKETNYLTNLQTIKDDTQNKPLSLYIHIPFCDTLCFFCACNKIATKKREKADVYLDHLALEMAMQAKLIHPERVVQQLHLGGGTPTFLTHQQMDRLMAMLQSHFNLSQSPERDFSIELDPRAAKPETIKHLANHGFNRFSMGVQDIQIKVQKAVNRIQPIGLTEEAIKACREHGAKSVNVDLIYGLPHQTLASFTDTLEQVIRLDPDRLSVFNYAHMPHLFKPQQRIKSATLPAADEKLAILKQTINTLTQAGYVYIGMDHFAKADDELALAQKNRTLHRNFQGYTTHADCDLLAMGVSAISHIGHHFSQNSKSLEQYYHLTANGHIPICKGHAIDSEDLIRKQVIQDLCCHFQVDFGSYQQAFGIDFSTHFQSELQRLIPFATDELIVLKSDQIQVSAKGRLLIRNICMVFDQHLPGQTEQRFSKVI